MDSVFFMEVEQMEEKTDIKVKTIKVDTGKGNTIKV